MTLPFDQHYDFVFGLGQMCANAAYMSAYDLRMCSSPFDWLDGREAGLKVCVDLICEDFRGFLLRQNLQPLPNAMGDGDDKDCDYYFDRGTGFRAMHEFPRGVPLDESYPQVLAKHRRRIDRLYARVRAAQRTLFVYWARFEAVPDGELRELVSRLRAKFSGGAVDLLVIEHCESAVGIASVKSVFPGVVRVVGRFYVSRPDGRMMGDEELNGRVYAAIPKAWPLRRMGWKRRLQRVAIRTLTAFCFPKARRKEVRKRLLLKYVGKETV